MEKSGTSDQDTPRNPHQLSSSTDDKQKSIDLPVAPESHVQTVLIVDDDAMICEVVTGMLEVLGYVAISVNASEEALARFEQIHTDLILLDLTMPKLSGIEFLEQLRERNSKVPVILASGHAKTAEISRVCEADSVCFLKKPFTIAELSAMLKAMLP